MRPLLKKIAKDTCEVLLGEEPLLEVHRLFLKSELSSWDIASKEAFFERFYVLEKKVCLQLALQKMSRKAMHSAELRGHLEAGYFSEQAIAYAIFELERFGALNDREYLEHLVARLQKLGKSSRYIQAKCKSLGLDLRELAPFLTSDEEALRRLISKRYPMLLEKNAPFLKKQKALAALYRQGFSHSIISQILKP